MNTILYRASLILLLLSFSLTVMGNANGNQNILKDSSFQWGERQEYAGDKVSIKDGRQAKREMLKRLFQRKKNHHTDPEPLMKSSLNRSFAALVIGLAMLLATIVTASYSYIFVLFPILAAIIVPILSIVALRKARMADKIMKENPDEYPVKKLKRLRRAKTWAWIMVVISIFGVILTALGVGIVISLG